MICMPLLTCLVVLSICVFELMLRDINKHKSYGHTPRYIYINIIMIIHQEKVTGLQAVTIERKHTHKYTFKSSQ